mmetsp:Transcript_69236/g.219068  ORF Transcript_69236/g.219068 Transcript_69236/m.219068 type:complete len:254 (-) Transcript_69236:323-1084(-)
MCSRVIFTRAAGPPAAGRAEAARARGEKRASPRFGLFILSEAPSTPWANSSPEEEESGREGRAVCHPAEGRTGSGFPIILVFLPPTRPHIGKCLSNKMFASWRLRPASPSPQSPIFLRARSSYPMAVAGRRKPQLGNGGVSTRGGVPRLHWGPWWGKRPSWPRTAVWYPRVLHISGALSCAHLPPPAAMVIPCTLCVALGGLFGGAGSIGRGYGLSSRGGRLSTIHVASSSIMPGGGESAAPCLSHFARWSTK